ncbi:MAG TPA: hypothetical protein VIA62_29635 [Thermoanaerobaculia bacterium]|jgi:hypothetical protein|nr:hypothetical protein [Thermoanaerobaculia bacterium]
MRSLKIRCVGCATLAELKVSLRNPAHWISKLKIGCAACATVAQANSVPRNPTHWIFW